MNIGFYPAILSHFCWIILETSSSHGCPPGNGATLPPGLSWISQRTRDSSHLKTANFATGRNGLTVGINHEGFLTAYQNSKKEKQLSSSNSDRVMAPPTLISTYSKIMIPVRVMFAESLRQWLTFSFTARDTNNHKLLWDNNLKKNPPSWTLPRCPRYQPHPRVFICSPTLHCK